MSTVGRTPLVVLAGLAEDAAHDVADGFVDPHTLVVQHSLRRLDTGVLSRRVRHGVVDRTTKLELAHGCVSCVLRRELLPLLSRSVGTPGVRRIVLHLDPALEPETICWALDRLTVEDRPLRDMIEVQAVITMVDLATWLTDATGHEPLDRRGLAVGAQDDRTVAQLAVGQVEFADAVLVAGAAPDPVTAQRTDAVLDQLAPDAPRTRADRRGTSLDTEAVLASVPSGARRGHVDDVHREPAPAPHPRHGIGTVSFGARRPFHPERLHEALGELLHGVVRARGRMWVASQPDEVLALESAGGALRVTRAGPWLGAVPDWSPIPVERALMASLRWDARFEDREQALEVVYHSADPDRLVAALDAALLSDEELAAGREEWRSWPDPFARFLAGMSATGMARRDR